MKRLPQAPTTIDEYIARQPAKVQPILRKVRATIQAAAPAATEAIKYQLPTFVLHSTLVHFGAFKDHIGFYALPSGTAAFQDELASYESGKGSIRFPLDRKIPYGLITKIVKFRVRETMAKAATKPAKKKQ